MVPELPICQDRRPGGACAIASRLAGRDVVPWENVCETCVACAVPRAENYVTASIATHAWRMAGDEARASELHREFASRQLFSVGRRTGSMGQLLTRTIGRLFGELPEVCQCASWASRLDAGGPIFALTHLLPITRHMSDEFAKRHLRPAIPRPLVRVLAIELVLVVTAAYVVHRTWRFCRNCARHWSGLGKESR